MKEANVGNGFSFMGLLAILFIGLKLSGHITWSWWLVLLPLYGGLVTVIVVVIFLAAIISVIDD